MSKVVVISAWKGAGYKSPGLSKDIDPLSYLQNGG